MGIQELERLGGISDSWDGGSLLINFHPFRNKFYTLFIIISREYEIDIRINKRSTYSSEKFTHLRKDPN